ncbi:MAG TPA: alpha/beta fold hydrolase [Candidatus Limnocylindrales bacterium]|nr:alpha/beta fold hydrolase [Candidatus Limnocylindrales bacterium]
MKDSIACYSGSDRDWHREILERCPSLRADFEPSWSIRSAHVQNLLTVVRGEVAPALRWDLEERLSMPDGGTVSIQWLGLAAPEETPVLVVLHTITGSGDDLRRFIAAVRARLGWVVAACNRRGHAGLELTSAQINTMGATDDLRRQLLAIESRRSKAALYGVGVSAGSGLIVRYLGEEGERSRLRAAVALCPAYDIRYAFDHAHPGYNWYLTRKIVRFFLHRNKEVLGGIEGYDHCAAATTMTEFHDRLYPLAGFDSREAYYLGSNPMEVARDVAVPVLVINAADDPVCVERNVLRHLAEMQQLPRMTLAVTRHGGHCGFFETLRGADSWADRAIAEYLDAVHQLSGG